MTGTDGIRSLQTVIGNLGVSDTKSAKPANKLESTLAGRVDQASLSLAGNLAAAAASPNSDVRLAKVAQLQQVIAAGTYNVHSSDVASKMIETLLNGR